MPAECWRNRSASTMNCSMKDRKGRWPEHVWLTIGIMQSTIKRFRLGYAPPEPDDLLSRHLIAAGFSIPKLLQTAYVNDDGEQKLIDRYGGGNLLIPICDS